MIWTSFHCPFLMAVDLIETNPRMKPFYTSFHPSMDDDPAIIFSSSHKKTKTSKIRLPPSSPPLFRLIYLYPNQRPSSANPPVSYFFWQIISAPPPPSTSMLVWTAKVIFQLSLYGFATPMSCSGDGLKETCGSLRLLVFSSHPRSTNMFLSSPIVCKCIYIHTRHQSNLCPRIYSTPNIFLTTNNNYCSQSSRVDSHVGRREKLWNENEESWLPVVF